VNLPQNVGPYENYKRIVKGVFFFGQVVGLGAVNFGNLATEKKKKMGTNPHIMRGKQLYCHYTLRIASNKLPNDRLNSKVFYSNPTTPPPPS
jgi:hypothetical protein